MPRPSRLIALLALAVLGTGLGVGVTFSAFSKTTTNSSNNVTGASDWRAPTVGTTTIAANGPTCLNNYIRQGGTYYVYGNATDPVSPQANTVASMTTNVSTVTTSATAVSMTSTGGPWSINGTSYAFRSAQQTAKATLSGNPAWTIFATDTATPTANSSTAGAGTTVTVDNTAAPTPIALTD